MIDPFSTAHIPPASTIMAGSPTSPTFTSWAVRIPSSRWSSQGKQHPLSGPPSLPATILQYVVCAVRLPPPASSEIPQLDNGAGVEVGGSTTVNTIMATAISLDDSCIYTGRISLLSYSLQIYLYLGNAVIRPRMDVAKNAGSGAPYARRRRVPQAPAEPRKRR